MLFCVNSAAMPRPRSVLTSIITPDPLLPIGASGWCFLAFSGRRGFVGPGGAEPCPCAPGRQIAKQTINKAKALIASSHYGKFCHRKIRKEHAGWPYNDRVNSTLRLRARASSPFFCAIPCHKPPIVARQDAGRSGQNTHALFITRVAMPESARNS